MNPERKMPLANNIIMDPLLVSSKRTIAIFSRRLRRSFYASSELRRHQEKLDESSNNFSQITAYPCFVSMNLLEQLVDLFKIGETL
ncbi:hypothetical protein CDAR_254201 [Caerostris darwini]|uniref:Uncharacterized protein n=1 Tax=Caerostris darwini TaxID=1538125 RepID=A0AAV4TW12_9ARAC|nr:hypothetical protein CDAR_254201 [Caerostris darwini]